MQRTRLIQTDQFVVAIDVELVIPQDDPSEPCYESETINLIREVRERAERSDLEWLQQHGKVYRRLEAA